MTRIELVMAALARDGRFCRGRFLYSTAKFLKCGETTLRAVALILLHFSFRAGAIEFEDLPTDYILHNWTVEDGLPQNSVTKIVQTPDGYLWFATYNGLARFDGVRITVFHIGNTPEMRANSIEMLHRDQTGRLTVMAEGGDGVWYEHGKFIRCSGARGLPDGPLALRGESPRGTLYFLMRDSTAAFEEDSSGRFQSAELDTAPILAPGCDLAADASGGLWYQDADRWKHATQDNWNQLPRLDGKILAYRAVGPARNGGVWMVAKEGVGLRKDREWKRFAPSDEAIGDCASLAEDRDGNVWIGTWRQGLWRLTPDGKYHRYIITRGKEPEAMRSVFEDREGNLWLGTDGSGLFRLRRRLFRNLGSPEGLRGEIVRSVTEDADGAIWVADQSGFEAIDPSTGPGRSDIRHIPHDLSWCVYRDRAGTLWMGDYRGDLYRWDRGALALLPVEDRNLIHPITAVTEDTAGTLWVGTSVSTYGRLWRVDAGKRVLERLPAEYMESGVRALAADHRGGIWAGLTRAGLFQREKGIWKRMDAPGILPQGRVSALAVDAEDTVWIGTPGAGLFRLKDGVYCRFDPEKTGLPRVVASITEDDAGYFWMGSTEGIFRIKRTDLNSWAAGTKVELRPSRYDRSDGLGTSECAMNVQPTVWRARDGRLWFATRKGLAVVDPREVRADTPPPPVLIEEAVLWGNPKKTVSLGAPDSSNEGKPPSIRVPPATRLMEIHYTAPSFSAPERVRFRYRLEGADPNWTEAGERRVAYYQGLSPGSYRFRVSACNVDGEWNENGADLAFVIEPHPWQTWWFRAALLAGVVGAAALAYNLRVERIKALNRLRLRIAGDLHDEIGANLGSISLNAQLLQRNPSLTSAARDEVTGLHRVAVQTAQAVRDLVWLTNPDFDNSTDMIRRMREVMNLQLPGRERKFDATGVTPDRPLSPEFRRNLFSVFKEALHNVAKHSGAASVEVKLRDTADGLEMTVADNGCGYRPDDIEEGHGLGSMRRRAAEMRGVLEVTSSPGKGTTITLTVAFEQPRRGWRAAGRQTTGIRGIQDPSEPPR